MNDGHAFPSLGPMLQYEPTGIGDSAARVSSACRRAARAAERAARAAERAAAAHEAAAREQERHAAVAQELWQNVRDAHRTRERAQFLRLTASQEREIARRERAIEVRLGLRAKLTSAS